MNELCEYERQRLERINANRQFFLNLGIEKVVEKHIPKKREKKEKKGHPFGQPVRRSTRLRTENDSTATPQLVELGVDVDEYGEEIAQTETYEYCEEEFLQEWIKKRKKSGHPKRRRSVPGIRVVGGRIYDSENGSTCHQCRQKTMDPKIQCTHFMIIDGNKLACNVMLDEMCLFNRYGQTIEQARATGEWKCPVCLDICNCSFCRRKKGLAPTGIMINRARAAGYESVHGYLAACGKVKKKAKTDDNENVDVKKGTKTEKVEEKDDEEEDLGEDEYEVEKILEVKYTKVRGKPQQYFKVKWLGYNESTWEPRENLFCEEMVEQFLAKNKKKSGKKGEH